MDIHHPDISLPIVARKAGEELLELLTGAGMAVASQGRSLLWSRLYPSKSAFYAAKYRLKKQGLIVENLRTIYRQPELRITHKGKKQLNDSLFPEKRWNHKWRGRWYVIMFDIPERERTYRNKLRLFLKNMRMGMLQKSVWITPFDIRPVYQDLQKAASTEPYVCLMESRTVLGMQDKVLAHRAWNFNRLIDSQVHFCLHYEDIMGSTALDKLSVNDLFQALRDETSIYRTIMDFDPLLPFDLYPPTYKGRWMLNIHRQFQDYIKSCIYKHPSPTA